MLNFGPFQCSYCKAHRRKEGKGRCYQSITQEVRIFRMNTLSTAMLTPDLQDCVNADFCTGSAVLSYAV